MKKLLFIPILSLMFGNIWAQQLTVNKSSYTVGEAVTVSFIASTSSKDWVAIYTQPTTPGASNNVGWLYTNDSQTASETVITNGSITFSTGIAILGSYKACLLANDGYTVVTSVNFDVVAAQALTPVGDWLFDDPQQLLFSSVGPALELVGSHTAISGPSATDGAVRIGAGSHYRLTHGIAPNNGALVNTYSLRFDFRVNDIANWHSFLQTNEANSDDAEIFIGRIGNLGIKNTGYSTQTIIAGSWNRLVVVVNNGVEYSLYLNAIKVLTGTVQDLDGRFALSPTLILFGDNDGEDGEIDVARVSLYNKALTETEVQSLALVPEDPSAVNSPSELDFSISPNPTKGILKIKAPENIDVTVFNLQGKKVFVKLKMLPDSYIDLSKLNQGAYLVNLKAGQKEFTKTIVIR